MSVINFPTNPTVDQTYDFGQYRYRWDGQKWSTIGSGFNQGAILTTQSREALRRSYADAGFNMVIGSFELGGTLVNSDDVLLHEASGKCYSGPAGVVVAGTSPTSGGFVDRSGAPLRKTYADYFVFSGEIYFTNAIKRGIQFCIENSIQTLNFKHGIYLIDGDLGQSPIGFVSDGKTIIRSVNTSTLGSVLNKNIIEFIDGFSLLKGVSFDGQVSTTENTFKQDPAAWTSSNYDSWYGCQGVLIAATSGFSVIDCGAENFFRHGIYITGCSDFTVIRQKTKRNRGGFGDGIFIGNGCHGFTVMGSDAKDFTRGGLVIDMGCYDFTIIGNSATNGHDWSALYGGTEYSAGLWIEKSTRGSVSGCRLTDTGYYGAIMALEVDGFIPVSYRDFMTLGISNARINGAFVGLNCRSANGVKGKITVDNVDSSVNSGCVAMLLRGFPGLSVDVHGGSATVYGDTAGACIAFGSLGQDGVIPVYTLRGVGVGHIKPLGALDAKSKLVSDDVGDICVYTAAEYDFRLILEDLYSLSDPTEILIGLRTARITPSWHAPSIDLDSIRHPVYYIDSSNDFKPKFKATEVTFSRSKINCVSFDVSGSKLTGVSEIYFNSLWEFGNNIVKDAVFLAAKNVINYVGGSPTYTSTPAFMLDSCRFSADLSEANSYLVDIRRVDVSGNRIGWIHRDTVYTNTGGNGVGSSAVSCVLDDQPLPAYKYSNVFDTLLTNVLRTSAGVVTDPVAVNLGVRENLVLSS